jgi:hypothetical protein
MQHQERDVVRRTQRLDQFTGCGHAHPFGRHGCHVIPRGELHFFEQRIESFFFAKQNRTESVARPLRRVVFFPNVEGQRGHGVLADFAEIIAHLQRAQPDLDVGVRLGEMAARVECDLMRPAGSSLCDVVRQQRLREILVERSAEVAIGQLRDRWPRRIHDLPGVGRKLIVARSPS